MCAINLNSGEMKADYWIDVIPWDFGACRQASLAYLASSQPVRDLVTKTVMEIKRGL